LKRRFLRKDEKHKYTFVSLVLGNVFWKETSLLAAESRNRNLTLISLFDIKFLCFTSPPTQHQGFFFLRLTFQKSRNTRNYIDIKVTKFLANSEGKPRIYNIRVSVLVRVTFLRQDCGYLLCLQKEYMSPFLERSGNFWDPKSQ